MTKEVLSLKYSKYFEGVMPTRLFEGSEALLNGILKESIIDEKDAKVRKFADMFMSRQSDIASTIEYTEKLKKTTGWKQYKLLLKLKICLMLKNLHKEYVNMSKFASEFCQVTGVSLYNVIDDMKYMQNNAI